MERLLIEFADLSDLLADDIITQPIRLNATHVTDPMPPIQLMSYIISVRAENIQGHILTWTYRHARIQFVRNIREEAFEQFQKAEAQAFELEEAITAYIIRKTGHRQHHIRPGLINIDPRRIHLHGHLPHDLFDQKEETAAENTQPTPPQ